MDKEHIEQAAKQAIHECYNCNGKFPCVYKDECMYHNGHNTSYDCDECGADNFYEGFIKGAQWRINSVWHDAETIPKENSKIVLIDKRGEWYNISYSFDEYDDAFGRGWESCVRTYNILKWAYVEDLLYTKTI